MDADSRCGDYRAVPRPGASLTVCGILRSALHQRDYLVGSQRSRNVPFSAGPAYPHVDVLRASCTKTQPGIIAGEKADCPFDVCPFSTTGLLFEY